MCKEDGKKENKNAKNRKIGKKKERKSCQTKAISLHFLRWPGVQETKFNKDKFTFTLNSK